MNQFELTDNMKFYENELDFLKNINECEHTDSIIEEQIILQKVLKDGDTSDLYNLGPFESNQIFEIIKLSEKLKIPIIVKEINISHKNKLTNKDKELCKKYMGQLNDIYIHLSNTAIYHSAHQKKKFAELNHRKKIIGKKLQDILNKNNISYCIYINKSRNEFIENIKSQYFNYELKLKENHDLFKDRALKPEHLICNTKQKINLDELKKSGNYGSLAPFYIKGKDYFETYLPLDTYLNFRNNIKAPKDHIAIKYEDIPKIRLIFEEKKLPVYVFYLCLSKPKEEEIYIQFVHNNDKKKKELDYYFSPSTPNTQMLDMEVPLSFKTLNSLTSICNKENRFISYKVVLPKGDLSQRENFKKIRLIVRTDFNLSSIS